MRLVCVLAATTHDVPLIATIAVSLAFAFVGGLLAVRLRLPPLVGYLLAGIVVGPFTPASSPTRNLRRNWRRSA
jgi:CPA2 family monovalent cation:H+ antiporter-2